MHTSIDLQPTLIGPRITIRPIRADDWDGMFRAASNPKVWELHPIRDRYTEPVFREFFDGALASGSAFTFVDHGTGAIIGSSRYYGFDAAAREIEIGWTFLAIAYWGGSYNREVKGLMLEHAFRFVDTVVFWVGETNYRSQQAMQKIGGVQRGGLTPRTLNGVTLSNVVYEITRETFDARFRSASGPGRRD
ncbi:MAG TPA: GNAT family N-acetyltransferase [Candidatus Limnocylindrales bacterium]|nr:GNAT family N-acetyltransferase [Candidatus Limnocylindrales bacterium]